MVVGRGFAEPVVHRLSPQGLLLLSAVFAAIGLYLLGHTTGNMLYVSALIFGIGVCYFWPTMIGFVAENLPKTGAVGLNLVGGGGMLAVAVYTVVMAGYYDRKIANELPGGADIKAYTSAPPGTEMATAMESAKRAAGPEVLNATLILPIILILAFSGLIIYMRSRKKTEKLTPVGA